MNVLKVRPVALEMFCACLSVPVAGQLRQQSFLSEKWDFRLDRDEAEDVWEQVDVPHTWNAKDGTSPDYYRSDGTYRYTLSVSPAMMKNVSFAFRGGEPKGGSETQRTGGRRTCGRFQCLLF